MGATAACTEEMIGMDVGRIKISNKMIPKESLKMFLMIDTLR